jgi:hypothetical protein
MSDTRTVYNRSQRRYRLENPNEPKKVLWLEPGASAEVSADEAKKLMAYDGVIDPAKLVKGKTADQDKETIQTLKNKIADLEAQIRGMLPKEKPAEHAEKKDENPKPKQEKRK